MTGNPLEFFQPGLGYWNEEKERQRNETHECFVDAPPWDAQLDVGVIQLDLPADAVGPVDGESPVAAPPGQPA
ncbi:MAG: hypothetical protein LBU05_03775 [Bifidobacteriaceae bacterium]|jgi:hypothetical protein|nr:hypothetical protein [Bifidobacteriaceae bacterium]